MERDSGRTFREIHGSEEALIAQLERIEQYLIRKPPDDVHFPLRFVTFRDTQPQPTSSAGNIVHLRLTELGEFDTSAEYVAVSYTWIQPPNLEAKLGISVPDYVLWTSETTSRRLRCPLVLHRALRFASQHLKKPLIWMDQECIIQEDGLDLETHIENMHKIYEKSLFTVAVLSRVVTDPYLLDGLRAITTFKPPGDLTFLDTSPRIVLDVEKYLWEDTWFTRTWAFQERFCATELNYLVPVSEPEPGSHDPCLGIPQTELRPDTSINARRFEDMHALCHQYISTHMPDLLVGQESRERSKYNLTNRLRQFMLSRSDFDITYTTRNEILHGAWANLEHCENSIVADRLAILANICTFEWMLKPREIDRADVSYSTCVLVLMTYNVDFEGFFVPKRVRIPGAAEDEEGNVRCVPMAQYFDKDISGALHCITKTGPYWRRQWS